MELKPLHWINNYYPGDLSFCKICAEKKIAEIKNDHGKECMIDGGWPIECDSPPCCDTCGCDLDYIPTDICIANNPPNNRDEEKI